MAERLCGFIDAVLPGRELALVGESYGGYLARGVVARRPGSILGLCLVCPVANPQTQKENSPPFAVLEKDPGIDSLLGDDDRRYFSGISVRQTASTLIRFREEVLPGLKLADHEWIAGHIAREVPFRKDVDEPGARHAFPALFLAGRQDNCVGYSDLWRLMEIYPRASYCALDMAGHNLQIEQPHLFASLAQEWLERVMFESGRKAEGASR
jgi:pimeloyl-ACP methyl ester carboxylesterase